MKRILWLLVLPALLPAQQQELGLTLGRIAGIQRSTPAGSIELGSGVALQANYAFRLHAGRAVFTYIETHFLANGLREISAGDTRITRDVAALYVTPGLRFKLAPDKRVQPYFAIGGGYALYEQSKMTLAGNPNPAPRFTHRGTLAAGAGVDAKLWRFVALRAEVRDFYSGNPTFNAQPSSSGQHNVVVGGGFVLRFGDR